MAGQLPPQPFVVDTCVVDTERLSGNERTGPPVVRRGNVVHRPDGPGTDLMVALLNHLTAVGFKHSPGYLGRDGVGRHMVEFVDGDVWATPPWTQDDKGNAAVLGRVARLIRQLHDATATFVPPLGLDPVRPLPIPGATWSHGDIGYPNIVFRSGQPVALIDWEFAAPADPVCDPAGLLAMSARGPRSGVVDHQRRIDAAQLAHEAIVDGYGTGRFTPEELWQATAVVLDDAANYWTSLRIESERIAATRWRADWFRNSTPA